MYSPNRRQLSRGVREVHNNGSFVAIITKAYGRLTVVQEVVEVGVGDGVAGLGPVEEGAPAISGQGVDAAARKLAPLESRVTMKVTHLGQSLDPISLKVP